MTSALLRLPALLHTTPHSFQKHIQSHTTSNVINGTGLPGSQNTFHPSETLSLTLLAPGCYFVSLLPFLCGNNLHRCVANRILVISTLVCTAVALTSIYCCMWYAYNWTKGVFQITYFLIIRVRFTPQLETPSRKLERLHLFLPLLPLSVPTADGDFKTHVHPTSQVIS